MRRTSTEPPGSKTLWMIWGGLLASIFGYAAMLYFVLLPGKSGEATGGPEALSTEMYALPALAVASLIGIYFVRRSAWTKPVENNEFDTRDDLHSRYANVSIVSWALAESVAINGLALTMLSNEFLYYVPFAFVALLVIAYLWPRLDKHLAAFSPAVQSDGDAGDW